MKFFAQTACGMRQIHALFLWIIGVTSVPRRLGTRSFVGYRCSPVDPTRMQRVFSETSGATVDSVPLTWNETCQPPRAVATEPGVWGRSKRDARTFVGLLRGGMGRVNDHRSGLHGVLAFHERVKASIHELREVSDMIGCADDGVYSLLKEYNEIRDEGGSEELDGSEDWHLASQYIKEVLDDEYDEVERCLSHALFGRRMGLAGDRLVGANHGNGGNESPIHHPRMKATGTEQDSPTNEVHVQDTPVSTIPNTPFQSTATTIDSVRDADPVSWKGRNRTDPITFEIFANASELPRVWSDLRAAVNASPLWNESSDVSLRFSVDTTVKLEGNSDRTRINELVMGWMCHQGETVDNWNCGIAVPISNPNTRPNQPNRTTEVVSFDFGPVTPKLLDAYDSLMDTDALRNYLENAGVTLESLKPSVLVVFEWSASDPSVDPKAWILAEASRIAGQAAVNANFVEDTLPYYEMMEALWDSLHWDVPQTPKCEMDTVFQDASEVERDPSLWRSRVRLIRTLEATNGVCVLDPEDRALLLFLGRRLDQVLKYPQIRATAREIRLVAMDALGFEETTYVTIDPLTSLLWILVCFGVLVVCVSWRSHTEKRA